MSSEAARPGGWPECEPEQVRVMLLGTYHMDNPGLDETNIEADDVLAPGRQAELRELADRLERWEPDLIAVERPTGSAEAVNDLYRSYREGEHSYDEVVRIDPPHPQRDDPETECRSEVVQIGLRLAERLGHDRVAPIDHPGHDLIEEHAGLREAGEAMEELHETGAFEPERKVPVDLPDPDEYEERENERLLSSTIPEYLRLKNSEPRLSYNHDWFFGDNLRWGTDDNLAGPRALSLWYDRNVRMVHSLWRAMDAEDERVLVVVGSGHVRVLRHLLGEAPMFCPVSPLPYL